MKDYTMWYFIAGLLVMLLGIYRSRKYNIEQDGLSILSMFLFWWMWLINLIVITSLKFISNDNK